MKQKKLASLLAVTLSFEMMVSPIIHHAQASETVDAANAINQNGENLIRGMRAIGQIYQTVSGQNQANQMNPQMAGDMKKMQEQQTPQPDKYFNAQKLLQIPGLGEYMAMNNLNPAMLDCKTLPTTLHEADPEVCRIGITNDKNVVAQNQLNQMFTYYNSYFQTSKMYRNFSADSNSDGQAFGIGCMNNAMNILNGFFKYRTDELDKLTTNLEAMQAQFKEASRSDLDAIEEAVAVLDGESAIADKVRSKKPDLFDFQKRFNNPACNSMFAGDMLNDKGREGGLNAISKDVKGLLTQKTGKYSGESYSQSHAAVVEDINSVADKVAKQFELNYTPNMAAGDYANFLKGVGGLVSSSSGVQDAIRPDLLSDVQTRFMEKSAKLSEERQTILSELGGKAGTAMEFMNNKNSGSFEAELVSMENNIKNDCLKGSIGSSDALLSKIYDPSASGHANKNASNYLKDKLEQILSNDKSSIEGKLAELKSLEMQQGNRYYMKMENSYEVQELDANGNLTKRVVEATSKRTPSVFFSDIIKNCNAQFKANKIGNKLTGEQAISKLRQLNTSYKELAKSQAADIRKDLRKKLVECSGPEIANNTVPGSCQPGLFNPSAPGFCANAALSCSKNMQSCSKQAEGFVKEIRDQKTARVNNYKALVEKNKKDIIKIFDSALARYMKDGEMMRGLFGAGFSSPAGIKREVMPESARYMQDIAGATGKPGSPDGKLLLEDPDKYVEMFKENIKALKKSVADQQNQILGGDSVGTGKNPGILADHIKKTEKNFKDVIKDADRIGKSCRDKHDAAIVAAEQARAKQAEEQQKLNSELGEKLPRFCRAFDTARTNPNPVCNGGIDEMIESGIKAANRSGNRGDMQAVTELEDVCRSTGNTSANGGSSSTASEARFSNRQMCDRIGSTGTGADKEYTNENCKTLFPKGAPAKSCEDVVTPGSGTTASVTTNPCTSTVTQLTLEFNSQFPQGVNQTTASVTVTSAAPSFCNAGDNSGRSGGKDAASFLETLSQELGAVRQ